MKKLLSVFVVMVGFLFLSSTTTEAHEHEGDYQLVSGETVEINGRNVTFFSADGDENGSVSVSDDFINKLILDSVRPNLRMLGGTVVTPHKNHGYSGPYRVIYKGNMYLGGTSAKVYVCGEPGYCPYNEYVRF